MVLVTHFQTDIMHLPYQLGQYQEWWLLLGFTMILQGHANFSRVGKVEWFQRQDGIAAVGLTPHSYFVSDGSLISQLWDVSST